MAVNVSSEKVKPKTGYEKIHVLRMDLAGVFEAEIFYYLGLLYYHDKKYDLSEEMMSNAQVIVFHQKMDRNKKVELISDIIEHRGRSLIHQEKYEEAEKYLNQFISSNYYPEVISRAYALRGEVNLKLSKFQEAANDFNQAFESDKSNFNYVFGVAIAQDGLKQYGNAIANYSLFLEFKPNHVEALFRRGIDLFRTGKIEEAIRDFERVDQLKPDQFRVNFYLALAYSRLAKRSASILNMTTKKGDWYVKKDAIRYFHKADRYYAQAIELDSAQPRVYYERAKLYLLSKSYGLALQSIDQAISQFPGYEAAHLLKTLIYIETKSWDLAKSSVMEGYGRRDDFASSFARLESDIEDSFKRHEISEEEFERRMRNLQVRRNDVTMDDEARRLFHLLVCGVLGFDLNFGFDDVEEFTMFPKDEKYEKLIDYVKVIFHLQKDEESETAAQSLLAQHVSDDKKAEVFGYDRKEIRKEVEYRLKVELQGVSYSVIDGITFRLNHTDFYDYSDSI